MDEHPRDDPSKSGHDSGRPLKPKELQAAALLAGGMKQQAVADTLGVSRTTIYRYEQHPGFPQAKETARIAILERLVDRSWSMVDRALDVIEESLDEKDPQTAMGLFKTMAPGLRDVRRVEDPEPPASTARELPPGETSPPPIEASLTSSSRDGWCATCGRQMKSTRGLAQHVRLTHPPGGGA